MLPFPFVGDQAGVFEDIQVVGNRREGHVKPSRNLPGRQVFLPQKPQNLPSRRVRQRAEYVGHPGHLPA